MPNSWEMPGTEGTGEYVVVLRTGLGRIGYRRLRGSCRIRVEPEPGSDAAIAKILTPANGWKQPDKGQNRYSSVVAPEDFLSVLGFAIRVLEQGEARAQVNPDVPPEVHELVTQVHTRRAIFISYRRAESQHDVQRIYDRLTSRFSATQIFRDIDSIPLGKSFPDELQDALRKTAIGLVVIGPSWVSTLKERAGHSITDFVQLEVEGLLTMSIPVIPCLVSHAQLPGVDELPESLHSLVTRQGVSLRPDPHFDQDMNRLLVRIPPYAA